VEEETKFWVGFNLVKGIGSARMRRLLGYFGSAELAWQAGESDLVAAGLTPRLVEARDAIRKGGALEKVLETIDQKNIQVLTWDEPDYPRRLKEIEHPPPILYILGSLVDSDQWAAAVVGTRQVTAYGRQVTEEIGRSLAQNGLTLISGLARGVDALAHQAALKNGGRTLAVLGSGVDQIYPPEHRGLAEKVLQSGALISDYPPGTAPDAANFPPRNRIISGLAQAVLVVEAGEKSGALITAAFAAEQGREIFAVPGYLYAPQSRGTNQLIHAGAHIYLNMDDVLRTLNVSHVDMQKSARLNLPSDATEASLYALLGREPMHVDEIQEQAELPVEQVTAVLTIMELKGLVRQVGNMRYIAIFEEQARYSTGE
jgi:DNA processing protein